VPDFDFKNPDYTPVILERMRRLVWLKKAMADDARALEKLKAHYRAQPWLFINDWGCTYDPRNAGENMPATLPFLLFPKQVEWCQFLFDTWKRGVPSITEKSRDMGITWLSMAMSATICLLNEGVTIGAGSRLEDLVDEIGNPDCMFWKARFFIKNLPEEFRPGWIETKHAPHMRIMFPATRSNLIGAAGDNIGRGGRTSLFIVDEAAHLARPKLIDAALSANTRSRADLSSVNGMANSFAQKAHGGKIAKFTFHWRDDPRKDQAWYDKQCAELDPVIVAQEIDINYLASVEGVVIPAIWVKAAIDAHKKLAITPTGSRDAALDVADEGKDKNAFCVGHGILVEHVEEWSGVNSDIAETTGRAMAMCDARGIRRLKYDADGLGAGVRGDARMLNERRPGKQIEVLPFRGSAAVHDPEKVDKKTGRKNIDMYQNAKAQEWFALRDLFFKTYQAIEQAKPYDPDYLISISSDIPAATLVKLTNELSQVTWRTNTAGKIIVEKVPPGTTAQAAAEIKSPNLADSVMIRFARAYKKAMSINPAVNARARS